jgi:N-acetylglucosaminyldiphosphoundecaprenol N-acetyl-beta-D-mannosaminyltransferase
MDGMEPKDTRSSDPQSSPVYCRGIRRHILGIDLDYITMRRTLDCIGRMVAEGGKHLIVTANVDHIITLQGDAEFRQIYRGASLALCDSTPVLWASYYLGQPLPERVAGSDLVPRLCALAAKRGWRLFLLGGDPGVAEAAAAVLHSHYPQMKPVGFYSPPFGFDKDPAEMEKSIRAVAEHNPDIILVGLGAPKQEKWAIRAMPHLDARVYLGVGASLDFVAGTRSRAPCWMRASGLEWFYRFIQEPGRLWRRYFIKDPLFFKLILKQKWGTYREPDDSKL